MSSTGTGWVWWERAAICNFLIYPNCWNQKFAFPLTLLPLPRPSKKTKIYCSIKVHFWVHFPGSLPSSHFIQVFVLTNEFLLVKLLQWSTAYTWERLRSSMRLKKGFCHLNITNAVVLQALQCCHTTFSKTRKGNLYYKRVKRLGRAHKGLLS